jgi:hypothetical protein
MKEKDIPRAVIETAKSLVEQYGAHFSYLGRYENADAYVYEFPEDSCTGFPFVYLLEGSTATEITGEIALHIINLTIEDTSEQ